MKTSEFLAQVCDIQIRLLNSPPGVNVIKHFDSRESVYLRLIKIRPTIQIVTPSSLFQDRDS